MKCLPFVSIQYVCLLETDDVPATAQYCNVSISQIYLNPKNNQLLTNK